MVVATKNKKKKKKEVFANVVGEYMERTTLHGYRYLTEPGRHWFERLVWVVVHAFATAGVVWQVMQMLHEYEVQEPVTTVQSMHYHMSLVPFPAVAVCDNNKMRRSQVHQLAARLIDTYGLGGISEGELVTLLKNLGRFYDNRFDGEAEMLKLEALFDEFNVSLDYPGTMQQIGTQCEDLLRSCKWAGKTRDCSELFETRKTMEGYCCTFNYIRAGDSFDANFPDLAYNLDGTVQQSVRSGPAVGLSVLVNSNLTETFYPLVSTKGVKMLVFNPTDYPDAASGGLIEKLIMSRQEVFFTLSAVTTKATEEVAQLPKARRKCLFPNEKTSFSTFYSYSECLMNCRVRSIRKLCGCLPFYSLFTENTRVCKLRDLRCLNKHAELWQTLRPGLELPGLELEMTQSLDCSDCLPSCGDTAYSVEANRMPLDQVLIDRSPFLKGYAVENHSVFHLFFGTPSQTLMKKGVILGWNDLLSNVGGICGVFVGMSTMSIIEFVYFFTVRACFALLGPGRRDSNSKNSSKVVSRDERSSSSFQRQLSRYHQDMKSPGTFLPPASVPASVPASNGRWHFTWE